MVSSREVPAFLTIDVEPDGFQVPQHGPLSWHGYDEAQGFLDPIRDALTAVGPAPPQFSWFLRMDPQIAATSPRADHTVSSDRDRIDRLSRRGDTFALHVHPIRWSDRAQQWVHDFSDPEFSAYCVETSVVAFEGVFGYRPRAHRYGGGCLPTGVVEKLEELGVRVELTPEPRTLSAQRLAHPVDVESGIDATPAVGAMRDGSRLPRTAYRPSRTDDLVPDDEHGRDLVMVPMTASRGRWEKPLWWRAASCAKHRFKRPPVRMMYPSVPWPHPKVYWDIVQCELERMPRPYLSISIRTDLPGSPDDRHSRTVLEYLPHHPLARRLRFIDPVAVAPSLLAPEARRTLTWVDTPYG